MPCTSRTPFLDAARSPVSRTTRRRQFGERVAHAALTIGSCLVLGLLTACGSHGTSQAGTADSTLARDLALANADVPANQPQLKDTAVAPAASVAPTPTAPPAAAIAAARTPVHRAHASHSAQRAAAIPATSPASASAPANAPASAPAPLPPLVVPSGTSFDVVLADTISTATAHVGDAISGTVAADVSDASGRVVIPAGTGVHGTVTASSGPAHTPHLGIAFSDVAVNGTNYGVRGAITALPIVQSRRTARAAQAGEVGGGAAVGALLGRAIGGKKSGGTVIGAIAGAAAGAVVADKTESHDAVLPKGARVTLQLTAPVTVKQ